MEDMAIPEIPPSAMEGAWLLPSGAVSGAPIGISDASGNICFAPCLESTTWFQESWSTNAQDEWLYTQLLPL